MIKSEARFASPVLKKVHESLTSAASEILRPEITAVQNFRYSLASKWSEPPFCFA